MNNYNENKILLVDDDPNILAAIQRQFHGHFDITTAGGGVPALEMVQESGPYATIISDMRMPGMSGASFLGKVRDSNPDTVHVMLTGYADVDAAIEAVNYGNIFRFLTKPCPPDVFRQERKVSPLLCRVRGS